MREKICCAAEWIGSINFAKSLLYIDNYRWSVLWQALFRASDHATPDRDGTLSTPTVSTYETLFPLAVAVKSPPAIGLIDGGGTLDVGFAAPDGQLVAVLIPRAVFVELQAVALV